MTYRVEVQRSGYIVVESFSDPQVAPTPAGHEHPPRTVAEVKNLALSMVASMGMDSATKHAARDAIRFLTKYDCHHGGVSF